MTIDPLLYSSPVTLPWELRQRAPTETADGAVTVVVGDVPAWRPPTTIDRAVAIGMSREQAEHFATVGQLDVIVRECERIMAPPIDIKANAAALARMAAPPPVAGNRLARRTAKAEQRRARR